MLYPLTDNPTIRLGYSQVNNFIWDFSKEDYNIMDIKGIVSRIFTNFSNYSQKEMAEFFGLTESGVSGWKSGKSKPRLEHLVKICENYPTPLDWLLTGKSNDFRGLCAIYFNDLLPMDEYDYTEKSCTCFGVSDIAEWVYYLPQEPDKHIEFLAAMIGGFLGINKSPLDIYCNYKTENPDMIESYDPVHGDVFKEIVECSEPEDIENVEDVFNHFKHVSPEEYLINPEILTKTKQAIANVKASYTETQNNLAFPKQVDNLDKNSLPIQLPDIAPEDFREIPFYPDEIAAGQPLEIRDAPEGIVIIHKNWCKQPEHMVAVRVSSTGTSMEPTIPAGAIVTIDTSMTAPKTLLGQPVAIYKKDDGATIKRLAQTTRGWCGIPDNRDPRHQVIMLEEGDRIIGKVNSVHYAL